MVRDLGFKGYGLGYTHTAFYTVLVVLFYSVLIFKTDIRTVGSTICNCGTH